MWLVATCLRDSGRLLTPEDPAAVWDRQAAAHINAERTIAALSATEVRGRLLQHWDDPAEVVWSCWEQAAPPHWLPLLVQEAKAAHLRRVARHRVLELKHALDTNDTDALANLLPEVEE